MSVDLIARGLAKKATNNAVNAAISASTISVSTNINRLVDEATSGVTESAIQTASEIAHSVSSGTTEAAMNAARSIASGLTPSPINFSDQEEECGTYNFNGKVRTLYGCSFSISNLPKLEGETSDYDISNEPLGFNLFISVDSVIISSSYESVKSSFFINLYEVTKVYVDDNLHTIVRLKCKENTTEDLTVKLKLIYTKFFGDIIEFQVTVPESVNINDVTLSYPKLKYNKDMVVSWINDDSYSIWNNIFSLVNKKWVDEGLMSYWDAGDSRSFFPHLNWSYNGVSRTNGYIPTKYLEYSDGAGISHRYTSSVATWVEKLGSSRDYQAGIFIPWNSAKEHRYMADFGYTTNYHDLTITPTTQQEFDYQLSIDSQKFLSLTDKMPKIMVEPNGNHDYIMFGQNNSIIQMQTAQTNVVNKGYPFSTGFTLNKNNITVERWFNTSETYVTDFVNSVGNILALPEENRYWLIGSGHRCGATTDSVILQNIENLYGISGNDKVWFTTIDEMYEWWFLRNNSVSVKSISGQTINYKLYIPTNENFWFKSVTVLLSDITGTTGLSISSSNNCKGTSYAINNGKLMINLDFNTDLEYKADKYVSLYENTLNQFDLEDAQYFVNMLKPGIKESYQARLDLLNGELTISSLTINNGLSTTNSRNIIAQIDYSGGIATHYMLSEDSNFSGATWMSYSSSPSFTLSDGDGVKTIYVKIKNSYYTSNISSDSITYESTVFSLANMSINSDSSGTTSSNVIITLTSTGNLPTQYRIGEVSDLSDASWTNYTSNVINYNLSSGYGLKTVYAQVKNETETSSILSKSIELLEPLELTSVIINNGDEITTGRSVNVLLSYTGSTPTHYIASELSNFSGATWLNYSSNPLFNLSSGNLTKTIYVKIKNDNFESSTLFDTITLNENINTPEISAVISFSNNTTDTIVYDTLSGGTVINYMSLSTSQYYTRKQFKSKTGDLIPWYFEQNTTNFYTANDETTGTTTNLNVSAGQQPVLTGSSENSGVYPDKYITKVFNILGNGTSGTTKGRLVFTLPVGVYTMKIIDSVSSASAITEAQRISCFYKINVNGIAGTPVIVGPSGFTGNANRDFNAELNFEVPSSSDGNVVLYIYNTANIYYKPGVNLVEITRTGDYRQDGTLVLFGNVSGQTVDGVGYVNTTLKANTTSPIIYDISGTPFCTEIGQYTGYFQNQLNILKEYWGITKLVAEPAANWGTVTLSGEGKYPNDIIVNGTVEAKDRFIHLYGGIQTGTTDQAAKFLTGVTPGNYTVKLLLSDTDTSKKPSIIRVNNIHTIVYDPSYLVNNNKYWITVNNVVVDSNGYMLISQYTNPMLTANYFRTSPIVLIEIIPKI